MRADAEVRFAPTNGHRQRRAVGLLRAKSRLNIRFDGWSISEQRGCTSRQSQRSPVSLREARSSTASGIA